MKRGSAAASCSRRRRRCAVVLAALSLCACESRVIIGYAPEAGEAGQAAPLDAGTRPHDAAIPNTGAAGRDTGTAAIMDATTAGRGSVPPDARAADEHDAVTMPEPPLKVNWPTGAHAGNVVQSYTDFGNWRGRALDIAHVFPDRGQGWDGLNNPGWPVDVFSSFPGRLLLSMPLYPDNMGNNKDCATGAYNSEWRKLGTFLVAHDRADSIIRLGWGPNDMNHGWRADADPTDWIACFRHAASELRAADPSVEIDWSFNPVGPPNIIVGDPYMTYPGDDYVDYIGIEAFDHYPGSMTAAEWQQSCNAPTGLCNVIDFVRKHGKKLGLAEWGVDACGPESGGDNSFYIEQMVRTFAANQDVMGYEAYFEDSGPEVCSSIYDAKMNPTAAGRYKEIYGAR